MICVIAFMEEVLIIPKKEALKDVNFYKGELTDNAWVTRVVELAAKKKLILQDPNLTDEQIVQQIKSVSQQLLQANKRLRQISPMGAGGGEDEEEEDGDLVTTNIKKWLKRLAKNVTPKTTPRSSPATPRSTLKPPSAFATSPRSTFTTPTTTSRPMESELIDFDEEEEPPKTTLTGSILDGALKGLTAEKPKKKKKATRPLAFTPPTTRSKTQGIKRSTWIPFN